MSGPPPPPPAAPPPPLPNFAPAKGGGGGGEARNALLKSIEKGTRLKKTVTNDRSAPVVGKTVNNNNNSNSTSVSSGMNHNSNSSGSPMVNGLGLGGLFANGMPKLRPTGKLGNLDNNSTGPRPARPAVNRQNSNTGPTKNENIQNKLKQQLANNDNRHRGPPPPAPARNLSDDGNHTRINGTTNQIQYVNSHKLVKNVSSLHQSKSNTNLSSPDQTDSSYNGLHTQLKQVISHGKPNLAPKPPATVGTLPNKNKKMTPHNPVSRSLSCRTPRSPSPTDSRGPESFGGNKMRVPSARPLVPPPSVPPHVSNNQSPMPKNFIVKPPNHAPPPPPISIPQVPQSAPPPPPHRTMRAPPAVPTHNPPPPPPRLSSMSRGLDLEEAFKDKFRHPSEFPQPPLFRKCRKVYSNRQERN